MKIPIYQIDAFTSEQFKGNPAAVCPLNAWIGDDLMQNIAMENCLSETAFLLKKGDRYELRWFTPNGEVDLCGHATLASAYVIFNYLDKKMKKVNFLTKSGLLEVENEGNLLAMTFPIRVGEPSNIPDLLIKGLGNKPKEVFLARDYMAVFETEDEIKNLKLDMNALKQLKGLGVIATSKGDNADFVSRFFAPKVGVNEDPVTGSSHCTLIPYWKRVLGKNKLLALQLSKRGGKLFCTYQGEKVKISGEAVTYLIGNIYI